MEKKISVIIPAYKNEKLEYTVNSVREFADEIIIVNSSHSKIDYSSITKVRVIEAEKDRTNASKARNIGASKATGKLLLFVDSDIEFPKETFAEIKKIISNIKEKEVYTGSYLASKKNSISSNIDSLLLRYRVIKINQLAKCKIINSSHFFIHKNFFEQIGGFNESIDSYEDSDFSVRAQEIFNAKVIINENFNAYHLKEYNLFNLTKNVIIKNFYFTKFRILNRAFYKNLTTMLDWKIYFLSFPLLISFLSLLLTQKFFIGIFFYFALVTFNAFLCKDIFTNYKLSFLGSIILSIISVSSYLSSLTCLCVIFLKKIFFNVKKSYNLFICLVKVIFKYGKPIQLIQYITGRCNLRCNHCFYKETLDKPDPGELPSKTLIDMARKSGPLLWYSLAGGEPFIRKDFSEIVLGVKKHANPVVISLPSNGWYTKKTYESCLKVLQSLDDGLFIVYISVDGPKETHDRIRGENSFQKLSETIFLLKKLSKIYPRLHVNMVITVQDYNCELFPKTITDLYNQFEPTSMSINLFRHHELNAPKISEKIINGYEAAIEEYEKIRTKKSYGLLSNILLKAKEKVQKDLILRVAKKDEFVTYCSAGNLSYVAMEDGSVKPCEILADNLGNIKNGVDTNQLYNSRETKEIRKKIKDTKCKCTFECAMSTNTLFNKDMFPKVVAQSLKDIVSK